MSVRRRACSSSCRPRSEGCGQAGPPQAPQEIRPGEVQIETLVI